MQNQLVEILKHKGIGPKGSKQLSTENISKVRQLLEEPSCNITTKATFLTALLLLEKNTEEELLVDNLKKNITNLPSELHFLLNKTSNNALEKCILSLINCKDLDEKEAEQLTPLFLSNETPDFLQASFLEALRLKRETDTENRVFYKYFLANISRQIIDCEPIIEIGDSFDGVERNFNFNLFTGCILAALGHKVLLTGNETVAPKKGITHHQILVEANKNPFISIEKSIDQLHKIGVVYIDQSVFDPKLWLKTEMRTHMVKRPFLATFEKILSPICSKEGNLVLTSYTHAHYKNANIEIFKNSPFINKALNIKGLEGTIHPKANVFTPILMLENGKVKETSYSFIGKLSDTDLEVNCNNTLQIGLDFIEKNSNNIAKDYVTNTVCMLLRALELEEDLDQVSRKIEEVICNNTVADVWKKMNQ